MGRESELRLEKTPGTFSCHELLCGNPAQRVGVRCSDLLGNIFSTASISMLVFSLILTPLLCNFI
jgi:hypothetical protein